ncbi:MAG: site-specific DNA-methyltransferase [Chloroflexi bacterium]|nr:site-specific DNA-methyltransferase [Chloroflexota bacterium]
MPNKKSTTHPKPKPSTPVSAVKHKDKRTNIPTKELRDFVAEDEDKPKTILYPRDPSLDPQLVWKGKDEQDARDLAVPAVPIYIQEKVQPQAIIENVRRVGAINRATNRATLPQLQLFSDFNGITFEDQVDFYHHEQNWSNRMILGDSLLVMTSLAEKEGLKGKVQMIYVDPPYGIKFGSNWQVSTRKRDVKDGKAEDATRQPEQIKAFRDTWELGIHSYLAYLRDRLVVARELLTESGSIFVQIGDENVHLVRSLLDEVFGSENLVSQILYRRGGFQTGEHIANTYDYILWFAKSQEEMKVRRLYISIPAEDWYATGDRWVESPDGSRALYDPATLQNGARLHSDRSCFSATGGESSRFILKLDGEPVGPPPGRGWSTSQAGASRLNYANRLMLKGKRPRFKPYYDDFPLQTITNGWFDTVRGGFAGSSADEKIYVVQTGTKTIERCLLMTTDPGDLVLDPTCGSGTTAYVAEQWGRRWITVDTSRVAIALARTRLMAGRFPYYLLADSPDGARKEAEITGHVTSLSMDGKADKYAGDIKRGFVYKRVPHITLKSIANNDEIDGIHAKWLAQMDPVRADLNRALKQSWEEWGIPREPGEKWPEKACRLHAEWWELRRERQQEIDASISRHAETELLYDQPYEDNKRVRVTGPFTVESLSPHRVLAADEERPAAEAGAQKESGVAQFENMIIENLKSAGVQNTVRKERLKFDRLESYANPWLHAAGEYTENGKSRRVAVCIGPEHGTVGPELIEEAAKEAVQGVGFDLLVVCGFAFDPHVSEEAKRYGKLTVLMARMNPDLAMGDELLKKTGTGNLFMVFGEPDVEVKTLKDGKLIVRIKGVDVYDPTTGEIRSNKTEDVACWFIDTDYNDESFFVRHAYFTGAGDPYEKLKRALRADIDEDAWSALYSTKSYPFDPPQTGKIAIKVINHYGDEVMKVYKV